MEGAVTGSSKDLRLLKKLNFLTIPQCLIYTKVKYRFLINTQHPTEHMGCILIVFMDFIENHNLLISLRHNDKHFKIYEFCL